MKERREKIWKAFWKRAAAAALVSALAVAGISYPAAAAGAEDSASSKASKGAVHDYGKSGDDPATPEDESAVVFDEDVMRSASYAESSKYGLKANGTDISVYKYQKKQEAGTNFYHMDVARFSSDDAAPQFTITLKDDTEINSVEVYPERYYPKESLKVSQDKKTLEFTMSESLRYCVVNINGTVDDKNGKPHLAIINDPTETDKPDVNAANVLNFKEFSEAYLKEHPITDTVGQVCTQPGTVKDNSLNTDVEFTWKYGEGHYQAYTDKQVKFPNKRVRLANDVTEAFQAALKEVKGDKALDTIYFPAGTYLWSGLLIKSWDGNGADGPLHIYTDEDALMVNRLQECQEAMEPAIGIWDSSNITISGRGIFDGQGTYNYEGADKADAWRSCHQGGCMLFHSQDITLNDTYVRDVKQWNYECHTVENIHYNNIKGLSPYQHSWVDGLDLTSGKNVTVNGSFTLGNDDTFASGHYNPSDGFPQSRKDFAEVLKDKDGSVDTSTLGLSEEYLNLAAAAGVYNHDRLEWDTDDSENIVLNNSLGWTPCANSIRLGHSTRWKKNPDGSLGSYQLKSYRFYNFNSVLVEGYTSNSGGGDAIRVQNGNLHSTPNYESLVFENCSFAGNNGANAVAPVNGFLENFTPDEILLKNCWFKDPSKSFWFSNAKKLALEDIYLDGKLVTYSSQMMNLNIEDNVGELVFTAAGQPVTENRLPVFTEPSGEIQAYEKQPLTFYVKVRDEDPGDVVAFDDADLTETPGAVFDKATGKFSWTPGEAQAGSSCKVVFTAHDRSGYAVSYAVAIQVALSGGMEERYPVAEDAHVQSWGSENTKNYGNTIFLTMKLAGDGLLGEIGKPSDGKLVFLKFDLSKMKEKKGKFQKAYLSMAYVAARSNPGDNTENRLKVAAIEDGGWQESEITWDNKPAFTIQEEGEMKVSQTYSLGSQFQDKPGSGFAVDGTKVRTDITKFVNAALDAGKDTLTLAVNGSNDVEHYFVSKEGALGTDGNGAGKYSNATEDMAPSIVLYLPQGPMVKGPEAMSLQEGYGAAETESFTILGMENPVVALSGNTGEGKITWDNATRQLKIAEGLAKGTYAVTLTASGDGGTSSSSSFTLTVTEDVKKDLRALYQAKKDMAQGRHTTASWKLFTEALEAAGQTLSQPDATAQQAKEAADRLTAAENGLVTLEAVQQQALKDYALEEGSQARYTKESWEAYQAAWQAVRNLPGGFPEAQMEEAVGALQKAYQGLEEAKPDHTVKVEKITVTGSIQKLAKGKKARLWAEVAPANAKEKNLAWESSDQKVAVVDNKGVVTAKAKGTATIYAKAMDGSETVGSYRITVLNGAVKKIALKSDIQKLAAGKKATICAVVSVTAKDANKTLAWSSSNSKYATVNAKGIVTAQKAGAGKTVTITAKAMDGSGRKASIKVKVLKDAVSKITLKCSQKTLKAGKKAAVKATVKVTGKTANKTLKWSVSNKKYASVNAKGIVTAKKAGKGKSVTVTAQAMDGSKKQGKIKIKIK